MIIVLMFKEILLLDFSLLINFENKCFISQIDFIYHRFPKKTLKIDKSAECRLQD